MAELNNNSNTSFEYVKEWVYQHKLKSVGMLWASGIAGSLAYNWSRPLMKTSVKVMHARVHSQVLTLATLAGAAALHQYYGSGSMQSDQRSFEYQYAPEQL